MNDTWQYQIRLGVSQELAGALREDPSGAALPALAAILGHYGASLKCQYDAFAGYVSEAEQNGVDQYPLYSWTRSTIENPEKKAKYLRAFTVYVNGEEVYGKAIAEPLEAALRSLDSGTGIQTVSKFDTNPANNPQPPQASPR